MYKWAVFLSLGCYSFHHPPCWKTCTVGLWWPDPGQRCLWEAAKISVLWILLLFAENVIFLFCSRKMFLTARDRPGCKSPEKSLFLDLCGQTMAPSTSWSCEHEQIRKETHGLIESKQKIDVRITSFPYDFFLKPEWLYIVWCKYSVARYTRDNYSLPNVTYPGTIRVQKMRQSAVSDRLAPQVSLYYFILAPESFL